MSQSQPTSSFPPPPSTSTAPLQSAASEVSEGSSLSAAPLTLESLASAIIDINRNIASMQAAWAGLVQQPSPPSFSAAAVHWGYRCELPAAASALEFPLRDAGLRPRGAAQSSSLAGLAVPDSIMGDGLGRSSGLRHYRHPSSRRARAVISSAAGPLRGGRRLPPRGTHSSGSVRNLRRPGCSQVLQTRVPHV